jgi:hypothetical protein
VQWVHTADHEGRDHEGSSEGWVKPLEQGGKGYVKELMEKHNIHRYCNSSVHCTVLAQYPQVL